MAVLNIVYGEEEQCGFFKVNAIALLLTLVVVALIIAATGLALGLPTVLAALGLENIFANVMIALLRWPLLAV
jgi:membrane protein